jgi:hypothetical protein
MYTFLLVSRQDLEQNQTSPPYPRERTPTHTESSRPPQQGHTTSHPQIAHEDYLLEDEQGLSMGEMLTVNFRQPRVLVIHWFRL